MTDTVGEILELWQSGYLSAADILPRLIELETIDEQRLNAFGISLAEVKEWVEKRWDLFTKIIPKLKKHFNRETLWKFWLPLGLWLADYHYQLKHPLILGILGCQGIGKTTLAAALKLILAELGYYTLALSLDDLYKTYRERQLLAQQEPRLIWRGPPGTHDIDLGIEILEKLQHPDGKPITIPRFDKSAWNGAGDRGEPEIIEKADIILFEGWFVGVRPISPSAFDNPPAPIITPDDCQFARDMNLRLYDYLPLWERLNRLIILYPIDYRFSLLWRKQAEQEMRAAGKPGMSDAEIKEFVNYFWKALHPELFVKPLVEKGEGVDLVAEIKYNHSVGAIYQPRNFHR